MSLNWGSLPQDHLEKVNSLLMDLKKHDIATYEHCVRVSQLCRFLAEQADLSSYQQLVAQFAGLLHDVGKINTPADVLNKPSRLSDQEYDLVKDHAMRSAELLEPLDGSAFFREVQVAVLHHHERLDGQGYPYGLVGEQIPQMSRLILVVDTVDAMTHPRPYRKGLPLEVAYRELERCSGTQFDPLLAKVFITAHRAAFAESVTDKIISFPRRTRVA